MATLLLDANSTPGTRAERDRVLVYCFWLRLRVCMFAYLVLNVVCLLCREIYQHTLGILRDAKTPRKLLSKKAAEQQHTTESLSCNQPSEPPAHVLSALQMQIMELQTQMVQMQTQAIGRVSMEASSAPTREVAATQKDNNNAVDYYTAPEEAACEYAHSSEVDKENQGNRIPAVFGSTGKEVKKLKNVATRAAPQPPPPALVLASPPPLAPKSPPEGTVRTEHKVVTTNTKPMSKPLVLATRVTQVHTSPPPPNLTPFAQAEDKDVYQDDKVNLKDEDSRELLERRKISSLKAMFDQDSEAEDRHVQQDGQERVRPKVSSLKAMFEKSEGSTPLKSELRSEKASPLPQFGLIKSPRPSKARQVDSVTKSEGRSLTRSGAESRTKSDVTHATKFDSSTAPTGLDVCMHIHVSVCVCVCVCSLMSSKARSVTRAPTDTYA